MNKLAKIAVIVLLAVAVTVIVIGKRSRRQAPPPPPPAAGPPAAQADAAPLPRLVDIGRGECIPCKKMAPVLEELRKDLAGQLQVEYVDLTKTPELAPAFGVTIIPTQIFYDAAGQERSRHVGFMAKDEILARFKEHGVEFKAN